MRWIIGVVAIGIVLLAVLRVHAPIRDETAGVSSDVPDQGSEANLEMKDDVSQTSLDLRGQQLRQVPMYVFDQRNLTSLDVSNNLLTGALQAEVRHLSKLKTLNLSNNQFTGLPAELGQLDQLETLNVSNNQLTGLPHELANLKQLKVLDLRGNKPSAYDLEIIRNALPTTTILVD